MLITFLLLAILTIGAVSASDDIASDDGLAVSDDAGIVIGDPDDGDGEGPGDGDGDGETNVVIYVNENDNFPITGENVDDGFVAISVPNEMNGTVIISSGENEFFNKDFKDFDDSNVEAEDENNMRYAVSPQDVGFFEGLVDGDEIEIAVFDGDNKLDNKNYRIFFEEDSFRLEAIYDSIDVYIWGEDKLYTDYPVRDVVSVSVPMNYDGTIFVEVNGEQRADWGIEHYDEDSWSYFAWGLEDLGITEADDYEIVVKLDEEILANETITVYEFQNDTFRAFLDYDNEIIQLYCPEGREGNLTVITYVETGKETYEAVFNETYDVAEYHGWSIWNLDNIGFERSGFWVVFTFTISNGTDELCVLNKGYSHEENGEGDDGDERFWIPGEVNINNPDEAVVYINEFPEDIDDDFTIIVSQNGTAVSEKTFNVNKDYKVDEYWFNAEELGIGEYGEYDVLVKFTRDGEAIDETYSGSFRAVPVVVNINEDEEISDILNYIYEIELDKEAEGTAIVYINGEKRFEKDIKDIRFRSHSWMNGHVICLNDLNINESGEYDMGLEIYDGDGNLIRDDFNITKTINVGENTAVIQSRDYGDDNIAEFSFTTPLSQNAKVVLYLNGDYAGEFYLFGVDGDDFPVSSYDLWFDVEMLNETFIDNWGYLKIDSYNAVIKLIDGDTDTVLNESELTIYPLEIETHMWDESDERGKLYTDSQGDVVSVDIPKCYEGNIIVLVNGSEKVNWNIEFEDDLWIYNFWVLEDLGITEADDYEIVVKIDDEILANRTITVYEFNNDTFRAMIDYDEEIIKVFCPEGSEGNLTVAAYVQTDKETYEALFKESYDVADHIGWSYWTLEELGFEHDGTGVTFTVSVADAADEEVYGYSVYHIVNDEEEIFTDYEFFFKNPNSGFDDQGDFELEYGKSSDALVAFFYIPMDYGDSHTTLEVYRNGELFKTFASNDNVTHGFFNHGRKARGFEVCLDLTQFNDKDILSFILPDREEDNVWTVVVEDKGDKLYFHEYESDIFEFDVFYGNITTGRLNNPYLMGPNFDGNLFILAISDSYNITEGNIIISSDELNMTIPLSECEKEYDYSCLGWDYSFKLSEVDIPEGEIVVSFNSGNVSIPQKRIRSGDYIKRIILVEDILNQYTFNLAEDELTDESDIAINLITNTNRQSIYIDLAGGYFEIYVDGVKVKDAGNLSYNFWKDNFNWQEDDFEYVNKLYPTDDGNYPNPDAFLNYVYEYWGSELNLFRLTSWRQGVEELNITLADLGITKSGTYNIKIIHCPDGLDNISTSEDNGAEEEYFVLNKTEVLSKDIVVNFHEAEPVDSGLTISVNDITYGDAAIVTVTTNEAFSGNVLVQIGDSNISVTVTNGRGSAPVSNLAVGDYVAKAFFEETDSFSAAEKNVTFKVNKVATSIAALAKVTTTYYSKGKLIVCLKDAKGNPISGAYVTVVLGKYTWSDWTNAKGRIYITTPKKLTFGKYYPKLTFKGNDNYLGSTGKAKLVVNMATPKLTYKTKVTYKVSDKKKKYAIALKTDLGAKMKNTKVSIKVNGVNYKGYTNNKGIFTFKLTKLTKKGIYTAYVKYGGEKNKYNALSKKVIITVK